MAALAVGIVVGGTVTIAAAAGASAGPTVRQAAVPTASLSATVASTATTTASPAPADPTGPAANAPAESSSAAATGHRSPSSTAAASTSTAPAGHRTPGQRAGHGGTPAPTTRATPTTTPTGATQAPTTPGPATPTPTATPSQLATYSPPGLTPEQIARLQARERAREQAVNSAMAQQRQAQTEQRLLQQRIAAQQRFIARLTTEASQAQQRYNAELVKQRQAQRAAQRTATALDQATSAYNVARQELLATAVDAYESGATTETFTATSVGDLLVAPDPNAVLSIVAVQQQVVARQAATVHNMDAARAALEQARAKRNTAVATAATVTKELAALRDEAARALRQAQAVIPTLQAEMVAANYSQKAAVALLSRYLGGWSTAAPEQAVALNTHWQTVASQPAPVVPASSSALGWTPAMGLAVVHRAIAWIGTPYAWAGGSLTGPTTGVCAPGAAANDCHIVGFDCSGLAMYAWAPYLTLDHLAADQYWSGNLHPDVADLLPGDLVFWSSDGTPAGIHHVAIYIGQGLVVQAPQSGDIVRITPLADVSSGYFGATRPLT